ncbi:putative protein binding protein [Tripterygium wilfordii]|uniref:Exocyst subunit Exo70 family protein n=1 Tax=Tripterygium wilfordii TaxID=458696 RepID=A0A7J7BWT7_TRIWF|nr:putative protein binding protein [Tripterygium wilfordii]
MAASVNESSDSKDGIGNLVASTNSLKQGCRDNCGLTIQWLEDIVEYLEDNTAADERSEFKCKSELQALDLDYLDMSVSEFNDVQSIEAYISKWGKHLESAVKHLLEVEYKLCSDVFERIGVNVWMGCFAKIASQVGILAFLQFGKMVAESKKDRIKLLKLLDIFASLNKLRLDFNRLFGGAACLEIQDLTRDLIKRVIDGAAEIFWELLVQVELQRQIAAPPDGGVPRLNYGPLVEQDGRSSKCAKYSVQTLEQMLLSLFRPKPGRYASFIVRDSSGKLNNGVADLRRTASAVM